MTTTPPIQPRNPMAPQPQQPPRRPNAGVAPKVAPAIVTREPRSNTLALTIAVAGLAFVVGSLVTLQLADMRQDTASAPMPVIEEEVTRSAVAASTQTLDPVAPTPTPAVAEMVEEEAASPVAVELAVAVATSEPEVPEVSNVEPVSAETTDTANAVAAVIEATAAAEDADQQARIDEAIAIAHRNKMRMLTEGVVAGLYTVSTNDDNHLVLSSVNAASSLADLEGFVETAAAAGDIALPDELASTDGSVDSTTVIFDLVQQALLEGDEIEQQAAQEMARRAFAASRAETQVVEGERFYVIEPGDSLAYIALQFYGNTGAYAQIYEANQDILESPDSIQAGQRIRIPNA